MDEEDQLLEALPELARRILSDQDPTSGLVAEIAGVISDASCGQADCQVKIISDVVAGLDRLRLELLRKAISQELQERLRRNPSLN